MKRFRPDSLDWVVFTKTPVLATMGLTHSAEILDLVVTRVRDWCQEILAREDLSNEQKRVIYMALNDIPTTLGVFHDVVIDRMMSRDQKDSALFMLAKMADDLIQLGAVYMVGKVATDLPNTITASEAGSKGGKERAEAARKAVEDRKDTLAPIFKALRQANLDWHDAKLIRETVKVYGKRLPTLPSERQLITDLGELIGEHRVPEGPKDGRAKKVRKPSASVLK